MKKTKWFVLAASLLLAAAFALAGCAGVGKLYDEKYVAPSVTKTDLTALDGYALTGPSGGNTYAIDAFGLFRAYKADTDGTIPTSSTMRRPTPSWRKRRKRAALRRSRTACTA